MGVAWSTYLPEPETEKVSTDEANEKLNCGASSMQGWRRNQEDAHNSLLNFDENTSLFAVYDGHGGHEVAQYCSMKLPQFIKDSEAYKRGDFQAALIDSFLGFDATITTKEVIDELKKIAGERDDDKAEKSDEENVNNLYEEAAMPIEQVIEKYTKFRSQIAKEVEAVNESVVGTSSCSTSGFRQESIGEVVNDGVSSSSCVVNEACSAESKEGKTVNANGQAEADAALPDSSDAKEMITSSKNDVDAKVAVVESSSVNGESAVPEGSVDVKSDVSSSSNVQENGSKKVRMVKFGVRRVGRNKGRKKIKKGSKGRGKHVKKRKCVSGKLRSKSFNLKQMRKGKALNKTKGVIPQAASESHEKRPKRNAKQLYQNLLDLEDSDEYSEDEEDKTFESPHGGSSEDEEENGANAANDDSESSEGAEEEDEDDSGEEEEEEEEEREYEHMKEEPGWDSGCTAVVALLKGNDLYVANAGDSRCVVCRNGQAVEMSFDHKPEDEPERSRILKAGGSVTCDGRVNGGLNLSRAIGDHEYKQNKELSDKEQMITALPDVRTLTVDPAVDEFMVLACDGIWNFMSSQDVVDFVRERIGKAEKLSKICEEMFDHCLAPHTRGDGTGCDNMTAIIVQFKSGNNQKRPGSPLEGSESDKKRSKTETSDSNIHTTE